jgi:hypothetical protein
MAVLVVRQLEGEHDRGERRPHDPAERARQPDQRQQPGLAPGST